VQTTTRLLPLSRPSMSSLAALAALALAVSPYPRAAPAQSAPDPGGTGEANGATPVRIVLLGTSHFAGSALDTHSSEIGDILSEHRQRELAAIAGSVADFGPERIFVECDRPDQPAYDSLYRAYRTGEHDPTAEGVRGEIQQLAFRMAERSETGGVTCADAWGLWLGDRARAVARQQNPAWLDSLRSHSMPSDAEYLRDHTMAEYLAWLNTDSLLYANYEVYNRFFVRMGSFEGEDQVLHSELAGQSFAFAGDFGGLPLGVAKDFLRSAGAEVDSAVTGDTDVLVAGRGAARSAVRRAKKAGADVLGPKELRALATTESELYVGFPDHYVGADLVGEWYKRNLRIYANLLRYLEPGDGRALLLIGQAHVWPLRNFLRANPNFEVVPVDQVL